MRGGKERGGVEEIHSGRAEQRRAGEMKACLDLSLQAGQIVGKATSGSTNKNSVGKDQATMSLVAAVQDSLKVICLHDTWCQALTHIRLEMLI